MPLLSQVSSSAPNATVVFSTPGIQRVKLEVCNDAGCATTTRDVTVLDPRPRILSIGSVPSLIGAGQLVTLSAQTDGRPPLRHRWILSGGPGDVILIGNPATWDSSQPGVGDYQLHLEVENTDGSVASSPVGVTVKRMTFADVPPGHWAWLYVESLFAAGITTGCAADPLRYCASSTVSRAEMAVFLIRAGHGTGFSPPPPVGIFADVGVSFWATPQIEQLYADGVTTGCAANPLRYCPADGLTRAEMAVFLLRAKHGGAYSPPVATGTLFADVPADFWAAAWIERLHAEGITTGCMADPLRFCPEDTITRDQMAAFLVRTFRFPTLP